MTTDEELKAIRKRMSDEYDKMEAEELKEAKKHRIGDLDHRMAKVYERQEDEFDDRLTNTIKRVFEETKAKKTR